MASDDVIELGSSDEEPEPAPKRRKPPLNAMVHIAGKLPSGVSVTPSKNAKSKINPISILKGPFGQAVTVTKIPKTNINPFATKKSNGNPTKTPIAKAPNKPNAGTKRNVHIPVQRNVTMGMHGTGIPIANNGPKCLNALNKTFPKLSTKNVLNQTGVNNLSVMKFQNPIPIKIPGVKKATYSKTNEFAGLPPGITIKKTTLLKGSKLMSQIKTYKSPNSIACMSKGNLATGSGAVFTSSLPNLEVPIVNLDDDEPATSLPSGPQWYLRPEDNVENNNEEVETQDPVEETSQDETAQDKAKEISIEKPQKSSPEKSPPTTEPSALEQQNNKEPDKMNFIEITIEDSPVRPEKHKKGFKVGDELAITIEDSPVKSITDKPDPVNSDDETDLPKDRNSKKKLEYPNNIETVEVEIEFEPHLIEESTNKKDSASPKQSESSQKCLTPSKESVSTEENAISSNSEYVKPKRIVDCIDIVEIEDSPVKPIEEVKMTTPKKNLPTKPAYRMTHQEESINLDDTETDEFSSIYQSFINLCFKLENSEDMEKIVEKKIKAYYKQVPKEFTESDTFTDMVAGKIMAMKASPEKMYLYIKDVVDELNLQRRIAKAQLEKGNEEQERFLYGEESEFDAKRQRQIRKLEKTLQKLHRAIQKLEEQEVDFEDEEDSVYLLTDRYKERSVRVHAKLCQLTNTKMPSEARVQIDPRPGQPKGPAKRIEKWINRKVPIGTPLPFPDFHDVLRCVRDANQEDKLRWNEADIMEEARDLFVRCGKKLQRRRQENEWRLAASRIPVDKPDPAEDSAELKRKLEENKRVAARKETDVFNKYADRQNQLKLEAVEIGDKEADESPVESDDEDLVEITDSRTNKEKRKDRLKRLLQEKSKVSDDNPDQWSIESEDSKDATKDSNEPGVSTKDDEEDAKKDAVEPDISDKELPKSHPTNNDRINVVESDSSSKSTGDGNKVDSDVDELHLLDKLYSDNEYNSVIDSSDTGSLIAISDSSSMDDKSSSDERSTKKPSFDVISIENSSYSESEEKKKDSSKETDAENEKKTTVKTTVDMEIEIEDSFTTKIELEGLRTEREAHNGLYMVNGYMDNGLLSEDVLLASTDESDHSQPSCSTGPRKRRKKSKPATETCIDLKDDTISIGNTLIVENRDLNSHSEALKANSDKNTFKDSSSVEDMVTGPMEINSEDKNRLESIVEPLDEENTIGSANEKSPEPNKDITLAETTNANQTKICSVQSMDDDNLNEASEISIEDTLIVENRDLDSDSETLKANSDKNTIKDSSSVEDMVTGPMEINPKDQNRLESIVEPLDEENTIRSANEKSPEPNKDISLAETTNANQTKICSVQSMDDDNLNEASENDKVETETPIQSIGGVSMDEVESVTSTIENNESNEDTISKEAKDNDFKTKEARTTLSSNNTPMNGTQDATQTENNTKVSESTPEKATKDNSNTPEAMEVDSLDQTL